MGTEANPGQGVSGALMPCMTLASPPPTKCIGVPIWFRKLIILNLMGLGGSAMTPMGR